MVAQFYVEKCNIEKAELPFFFFIGDEGYYPKVRNRSTKHVFEALMKKFETFFIHWPYFDNEYDKRISKQWKDLMGERFIVLKEDKAIVDVMLGIISMISGVRNLDSYIKEMEDRGQSSERIETVANVIKDFEGNKIVEEIL